VLEVLQAIESVLNDLGKKKGKLVTEDVILAQYSKMCMCLNSIVQVVRQQPSPSTDCFALFPLYLEHIHVPR